MRVRGGAFVVAALAAAVCAVHAQITDSAAVLAASREALGGDVRLAAVKTFTATGRIRQVRGNNLVPIEFEINCELPDKFVRKDEVPAQDTDLTVRGFNGDTLIQFPVPPPSAAGRGGGPRGGGPPGGGPPIGGPPRVTAVKQDFVRLTLGMFAASFPSYPLTFKYAGLGEAPEGQADVLEVAGPDNFSARFIVQRATHLPVMVMWQVPPPAGRQAPAEARPIENRLYYSDFRDVNGLKWPFRIRRAVAGETVEETTFDRIRINTKIDPKKFEVPK
jgi:hypothetical protein